MSLLLLFGGSAAAGTVAGSIALTGTGSLVLSGTVTAVPDDDATGSVISAAAFARDDLSAPLATLDNSFARKWRDPLNEAGAGQLTLQNTDPDLDELTFGRVVTFSHDDEPRWSMLVRRHDRVSRAPGEERDQVTVVSGVGTASVLEEADVYPEGGVEHQPFADVRYFNFANPLLDTSSWTTPVEVAEPPFTEPTYNQPRIPVTAGWPNPTGRAIWSRAQEDPGETHPVGTSYFRANLTVAAITEIALFVLFDDEGELWVDGLLVLNYIQPGRVRTVWPCWEAQQVNITLSPGTHVIAAKVTNRPLDLFPINVLNSGGLVMAVYTVVIGAGGTGIGDLLLETNTTDWICLDYPAVPPGFTAGEVMNILMDEAQERDALTDVTRTWADGTDSGATPWPITSDITIRVGLNYYAVARQLTEGYMDFDFAPDSLAMSLWVQRGADVSSTAQLQGGINLRSLKHSREG